MITKVFCVFAAITLLCVAEADAARYYVKDSIESSGSGLNWAEAKKTVAEAVDLTTNTDEVWVAAGTYIANSTDPVLTMKSEVAIHGGFAGTETSLSQRNIAANPTILDGANLSNHVVVADNIDSGVLTGFIIQRGNNTTSPPGAGMYINLCWPPLRITDCTIQSNRGRMGGVYIADSTVTMDHCAVVNNRTTTTGPGGIYVPSGTQLTLRNCAIAGNQGYTGGGLYITNGSVCLAYNSSFSGNVALNGGGICSTNAQTKLDNCLITGNKATQKGAGMYSSGGTYLYYCTLDGNSTMQSGAASYVAYSEVGQTVQSMWNCIITNNNMKAIYSQYGVFTIIGYDLFYDNMFGDYSYETNWGGPVTTLTGASALNSLYTTTTFRDGNPVYTGSVTGTWSQPPVFDMASSTTLLTCESANLAVNALVGKMINPNYLGQPVQCYVMSNTQTTITVSGDATSYASIGNSWQVMSYTIGAGSAAIDVGTDMDDVVDDIIGTPRPTGSGYDMGAYEYTTGPSGPMDIVWLDFPWSGAKMGTEPQPFSTLDDALTWVTVGGTIKIKPGSAAISMRITSQVRIEAPSGGVRIGAN